MAAATITQDVWEALQRQIATHNEQRTNAQGHVESHLARIAALEAEVAKIGPLQAEVAKIGPLEIAVAMLEDQTKETKAKIDLAVEIMTRTDKNRTLVDDKHKARPTFDGTDPKRFIL